jgi:hypothetical protein
MASGASWFRRPAPAEAGLLMPGFSALASPGRRIMQKKQGAVLHHGVRPSSSIRGMDIGGLFGSAALDIMDA